MGIDFLDILFRLEKRFEINCTDVPWEQVSPERVPLDISAGELAEVIDWIRLGRPLRVSAGAPEPIVESTHLASKRPVLAYYSRPPVPPLTGEFRAETWEGVKEAILAALRVPPEKVVPHAWLVRDLGMT